jgi:hypothetical protein
MIILSQCADHYREMRITITCDTRRTCLKIGFFGSPDAYRFGTKFKHGGAYSDPSYPVCPSRSTFG